MLTRADKDFAEDVGHRVWKFVWLLIDAEPGYGTVVAGCTASAAATAVRNELNKLLEHESVAG